MRFEFQNLGRIKQGGVQLGDLTLICGRNNSGKTYASYAVHCFLREFRSLARANFQNVDLDTVRSEGAVALDLTTVFEHQSSGYQKASERFVERLPDYFSVDEGYFSGAQVHVSAPEWSSLDGMRASSAVFSGGGYRGIKEPDSEELVISAERSDAQLPAGYARTMFGEWWSQAAIGYCVPTPFAITSERTGVSLFYKDLDLSRNRVIEQVLQASGKEVDLFDLVLKNSSRYSLPVRENIDAVRSYEALSKKSSFLADDLDLGVIESLDALLGGGFAAEKESLSYAFKVKGIRKKQRVPIYVASSAVKSLLLLDLFVRHVAAPNSILIIDEPELNLHPANQRKIAGLLVRLVNAGVRVLATTHSDFIIREVSARIALHGKDANSRRKFLDAHGLDERDLLDPNRVKAFSTEDGHISAVGIDDSGIEMESINHEIAAANTFFEDAMLLGQ